MSSTIEYSSYTKFYQLSRHKSDNNEFENCKIFKQITDANEAIWCMKFSSCGQLLATAGGDHMIRIYCCHKAWKYFSQLRIKASGQHISPSPSKEREPHNSSSMRFDTTSGHHHPSATSSSQINDSTCQRQSKNYLYIEDTSLNEDPLLLFSIYQGHTADILDVTWSKNHFLLSSSMDKTVRLWHVTRVECLCTFFHADFVSTAQFHPHDDRYFVSGSLDGKLRLWNIPDKKVTMWNEVMSLPTKDSEQPSHGLITASAFVQNGKFAVIGTHDGRIIFYSTEQLKFFTQLMIGKNHEKVKITGIESVDDTKILVTTNDSRIRLYDLRDLSLVCKYKGCINICSQIRATVSQDNKYIICGSENSSLYIWPMFENSTSIGQRKDRNYAWECMKFSNPEQNQTQGGSSNDKVDKSKTTPARTNVITAAAFAPIPQLIVSNAKYVILVADLYGTLRILNA